MSTDYFVDKFKRKIGSVRISLTDRCNLRCQYCMPEEGVDWVDRSDILSFEEILRLVRIFYDHNIRKYRLTGGEPTIRKDYIKLIKKLKENFPDIDLTMTTNGINLADSAIKLKKVGLDRLNISLDTLDHEDFFKITRRNDFEKVISGIKASIDAGFTNTKINAVSIKSFNDDISTLMEFIDFSEKNNLEIRFIELMPFTGNSWEEHGFVSSKELREKINKTEELIPLTLCDESSTSKVWTVRNQKARIGFISSVSETFCRSCNRIRITAEGNLRPCLHNSREYDLKSLLRNGKTDGEIIEVIKQGLNEKWKEHPDFLALKYNPPINDREMIRIGG